MKTYTFHSLLTASFLFLLNITGFSTPCNLSLSLQAGPNNICSGTHIYITAVATGDESFASVKWTINDTGVIYSLNEYDSTKVFEETPSTTTTYIIKVTDTISGCSDSSTITVNVYSATLSITGLASQYCSEAAIVNLTGSPVGGTFNGTGISGSQFNPTSANIGIDSIIYSYIDGHGCGYSIKAGTNVEVRYPNTPEPTLSGLSSKYCGNASIVTLQGNPAGGVFSGVGVSGNQFYPDSVSGVDSVTYTYVDSVGCTNEMTLGTTVEPPQPAPSLCYITVDTSSKYNDLYWDKSNLDTTVIDSFRVYSKTTTSYTHIGNVSVHAPSSFVDVGSNPNVVTNFYELSVVDACGQESPLSNDHQTILLQANIGVGNTVNLSWNGYVGNTVIYYVILRDDFGTGNWHKLDSVSSGVFAYTDNNPPNSSNVRYVINTVWNLNCIPSINLTGKRVTGSEIFTSYSNRKSVSVDGINNLVNISSINVYPNPVKDILSIQFHSEIDGNIILTDVLGQQVYSDKIIANSNSTKQIDIRGIPQGVYILKIESNGQVLVKKILKA